MEIEKEECPICLEMKDIVMFDCEFHKLCKNCYDRVDKCPTCRFPKSIKTTNEISTNETNFDSSNFIIDPPSTSVIMQEAARLLSNRTTPEDATYIVFAYTTKQYIPYSRTRRDEIENEILSARTYYKKVAIFYKYSEAVTFKNFIVNNQNLQIPLSTIGPTGEVFDNYRIWSPSIKLLSEVTKKELNAYDEELEKEIEKIMKEEEQTSMRGTMRMTGSRRY